MSSRKLVGLVVGVVGLGLRLAAAEVPPAPPASDDPLILAVAQSSTGFAADLYAQLRTRPGNFAIAPLGLAQALLPIAAGGQGTAGVELATVLHLSVAPAEAADGCTTLTRRLERAAGGETGLAFARALWVRQENAINPDFVEVLRQHCSCELRFIDFDRGDHAIHWMNRWISARTDDRILAIADASTTAPDASLVVGSAVYFDAEWQEAFDPTLTVLAPFHLPAAAPVAQDTPAAPVVADASAPVPAAAPATATEPHRAVVPAATAASAGPATPVAPEVAEVPTMRRLAWLRAVRQPGYRLVQLPYRGERFAMVVVLPEADATLAQVEADLSAARIAECLQLVGRAEPTRVDLRLPRFQAARLVPQLSSVLQEMGAKTVFDPNGSADFSSMGSARDDGSLYLSAVNHLVKFAVAEEGTHAAAATGVPSAPADYDVAVDGPLKFHVNRPFLFWVCDPRTGSLLFMGRVVDPRAG